MSNDTETPISRVDRKTASTINPLIDPHDTTETLGNVSESLTLLGQIFVCCDNSKAEGPEFGRLHYLIRALKGALDYESEVHGEKRGTPEAPVKRVK